MENPATWIYLKVLSGTLIELIQYYFTQWSPYHTAIRSAVISIVFSAGLAWMGLLILRSPVDRMKGVVGAGVVIFVIGILLSSSDKSSTLYMGNNSSGAPVANGSYWSYTIIGNAYSILKSSSDTVFNSELGEYYGGLEGPTKDKLMIAYDDAAKRNANEFEGSNAHKLYVDYMQKCNKAALDAFGVNSSVNALKGVGLLGSTRIAIDERDTDVINAAMTRMNEKRKEDIAYWSNKFYDKNAWALTTGIKQGAAQVIGLLTGAPAGLAEGAGNGSQIGDEQAAGEALLKEIPFDRNPYDGKSVGYLIETKASWDKKYHRQASGPDYMDARSDLNGAYSQGGVSQDKSVIGNGNEVDGAEARKFYPKNCFDAYKLSSEAIKNWRDSNADDPSYTGSKVAGAYMSSTSAQRMGEQANQEVAARIKAAGGTLPPGGLGQEFNSVADATYQAGQSVFADIAEWMLRYKVPMTILTVAMLAAALLIAFPLFCLMAVFMGPGILWTYLKLLTLCFLVGYFNDLFLGMAANAISANAISIASDAGYLPGSGSLANDMAASGTKAVIFSALTVLEIVFAKVLLWDDVKAIGSFNPGSIGVDAASSGLKSIGSAAMAVASFGKSAIATKAVGSSLAKNSASAFSHMSKSLSHTSQMMSNRPKSTGNFTASAVKATMHTSKALSSLVPKKPSGGNKGGGGNDGGKPKS